MEFIFFTAVDDTVAFRALNQDSTSSIRASGVDVPAVIPTVCSLANQSACKSSAVWT